MEFGPESPEDDCLLDVAGCIVTVPLFLLQGGHAGHVTLHFLYHGIVIDILLVTNEEKMYNEEQSECENIQVCSRTVDDISSILLM